MFPMKYLGKILAASLTVVSSFCMAESLKHSVLLDTGERLIGSIESSESQSVLILNSGLLGQVELPRDRIVSMREIRPTLAPGVGKTEIVSSEASHNPIKKETSLAPESELEKNPAVEVAKPEPALVDKTNAPKHEKLADWFQVVREFRAPDAWKGNLRFGLNFSSGDNKWSETSINGNLEVQNPGSKNFYRFRGHYSYRETENRAGETFKSVDRYDGNVTFRRRFADVWFLQNSVGARVDQRKGIDLEVQDVVGIGYKYKPSKSVELLIGGGGGVEKLEADFSVMSGNLEPVGNIFQEFTWKPWARTSFIQKLNYFWNTEDSEDYNYILSAAFRVRMTELLGFEFSYSENFDNFTDRGIQGEDIRWRNALVVYF